MKNETLFLVIARSVEEKKNFFAERIVRTEKFTRFTIHIFFNDDDNGFAMA